MQTTDTVTTAPPGSEEARKEGCTCPVVDNQYGEGRASRSRNDKARMFYVSLDCKVHVP